VTKWQDLVKLNFGRELKFTQFLCCWHLDFSVVDSSQRLARLVCDDYKTRHSSTKETRNPPVRIDVRPACRYLDEATWDKHL
jgi:hypothetical protein